MYLITQLNNSANIDVYIGYSQYIYIEVFMCIRQLASVRLCILCLDKDNKGFNHDNRVAIQLRRGGDLPN